MGVQKLDLQKAKEQAAAYFGFAASVEIDLDGETYEIPHPRLVSVEQREAIDKVHVRFEQCQREPDVPTPDIKLSDGSIIQGGGRSQPGPFKEPRRDANGELMDPPWDVAICQALWGEEKTKRFIAAGGPPGIVEMTWSQMNDQYNKRMRSDPK